MGLADEVAHLDVRGRYAAKGAGHLLCVGGLVDVRVRARVGLRVRV